MIIKNLTPHPITLKKVDGSFVVIQPETLPARVSEITDTLGDIDGIAIVTKSFGIIVNLPEPQPDIMLVVSALVATRAWELGRQDVYAVGNPLRDAEGRIIGAAALCANPN
jgi:hypothetical protein